MTPEQLRTRMRDVVSRYTRSIADDNGVPHGLVEDLAGIAEEHAADCCAASSATVARRKPRSTDQTT